MASLTVDLTDLVFPKQVQVVQDIDIGKLQVTLQAIIDAVNENRQAVAAAPSRNELEVLQSEIEALKRDSAAKTEKISELQTEQVP
mmetsp:Transcript_37273/g.88583  ORF Transcript_37273/g.88583 Transcript_37273/m.88583 type:complete len:86 (-) Transcript_37273:172-429(-)